MRTDYLPPVLVLDMSGLMYAWFFAMRKELETQDSYTGLISHKLFTYLLELGEAYKTHRFVFAWDSKSSKRKEIYPAYKANRKDKDPDTEKCLAELSRVMDVIRIKMLPLMGFNNSYMCEGYEADDIIAHVCQEWEGEKIIVSGDEDLLQLLGPSVKIFAPRKQTEITWKQFMAEYKITPKEWAMVKAMAGCKSDNVEGIKGVGETYALNYINELHAKVPPGIRMKIECNKKVIDLCLSIVKLPMEGSPTIELLDDCFSTSNYLAICDKLSLLELRGKVNEWGLYAFNKVPN